MSERSVSDGTSQGLDPRLADLAEQITRRLERGEAVVAEQYAREFPDLVEDLRGLLPILTEMARLSSSASSGVATPGPMASPTPMLGEFRVLRTVGRGGMGIVYEAEQVGLQRRVALKMLPAAALLDDRARQRFRLEAQATALLQHPHIVPVYAVGEVQGTPFAVMPLIDGRNLAQIIAALRQLRDGSPAPAAEADGSDLARTLARGLITPRSTPEATPSGGGSAVDAGRPDRGGAGGASSHAEPAGGSQGGQASRSFARAVARLGIQAAQALQHAHEQGILHRDIKPANLLLDRAGTLWLTDFGLARLPGQVDLTQTGDAVGTLRYMSPEQARADRQPLDHRTDLYSLGATLYELLALRPAQDGQDRALLLRQIAEYEPTPLNRLNAGVSVDLATVLAKAMAKAPGDRYATAAELAEDLQRYLDGRTVRARRAGAPTRVWRWCRRRPVLASLALGLVLSTLIGVVGITWNWREAVRQRNRVTDALLAVSRERDRNRELSQEAERARAEAVADQQRAREAERTAYEAAASASNINRFLIDKLLLANHGPVEQPLPQRSLRSALDQAAGQVGSTFPDQPRAEAAVRRALAGAYHDLGAYELAITQLRAALAHEPDLENDPTQLVELYDQLGHALSHVGDRAGALAALEQALAIADRRFEPSHPVTLRAVLAAADGLIGASQFARAESLLRRYLGLGLVADATNRNPLLARYKLAYCLESLQRPEEAQAEYRQILGGLRLYFGPVHQLTLSTLNNLGGLLFRTGRSDEAEPLLREAVASFRAIPEPQRAGFHGTLLTLGLIERQRGNWAQAEPLLREALERATPVLPPEHPVRLEGQVALADCLARRGQTDEARALLTQSLAIHRRLLGAADPRTQAVQAALTPLESPEPSPDPTPPPGQP